MLYFSETVWDFNIRRGIRRGLHLVLQHTPAKGYFLSSSETSSTKLGKFAFKDALGAADMGETTDLFTEVVLVRASDGWKALRLVFKHGRPTISHGHDCPVCCPEMWQAYLSTPQGPANSSKFLPYQQGYSAGHEFRRTMHSITVQQSLQRRHEVAVDAHGDRLARLETSLFAGAQVHVRGFSVQNLRDIAANMDTAATKQMKEENALVDVLVRLWVDINGRRRTLS